MKTLVVSSRLRALLVSLLTLCALLVSQVAAAAGRVEWKSKEAEEREGGNWRLEMAIYLPSAPDVAHVPMKFEFQPIAYYERAMMDGDKLVERVVPLDNRQALIESVDVGFLDAGNGKIENRTRFSFKVTRAHGYEAGEYKVTIRDARNGNVVGAAQTLKFKGQNEIIDRRAMVFSGEKKKKKKDPEEGEKKEGGDSEKKDDSAPKSDDSEKSASDAAPPSKSDSDSGAGDADEETIKKKPGGCGCRLEASQAGDPTSAALALALGAMVVARRRRRAA
ncbi:MAG: MYXO-CTERM sorting domain-containing protein [Polyangiaceae bacterium]